MKLHTFTAALFLAVITVASGQRLSNEIAAEDTGSVGTLVLREVVTGLDHPWAVAPLPDGGLLISERSGTLWLVTAERTRRILQVHGLPDLYTTGQGGLLDVILSPEFDRDSLVYFSYASPTRGGAATAVGRGRLTVDGMAATLADRQELFRLNRSVSGGRHFGSRLAFDRDGHLYISIGDRGQQDHAQDPANHQGSVVRINPDGSVPQDNPDTLILPPTGRSVTPAPGVYTWGHRNSQGIALHPETGEIWLHEHGPRGGDEINILRSGENYGWPLVTYGVAYSGRQITDDTSRPGFVDPLLHWTPSIAPSGMAFVQSVDFPEWRGDILVGALAGQHLRRVDLDSSGRPVGQEVLFSGFGRFRDVRVAPDGSVYVLTDASRPSGALYRLERR